MSTSSVTVDQLSSIVNRAAANPEFRAELLSNPSAALESAGISIPANASIRIVENAQNMRYAVVGTRPADISDADLAAEVSRPIASDGSVPGNVAAYAQLIAKSWTDSSLRSQLLSDPSATLSAYGISVPSGVQVKAIEASASNLVLAIPPAAISSASRASTSDSEVSLGDMAESITSSLTNVTKLITAGSYLAGLAFSIGAIMKFKQHKDNPTQTPIDTPMGLTLIAAILLFLPSILNMAGQTMFGDAGSNSGPTGDVFN